MVNSLNQAQVKISSHFIWTNDRKTTHRWLQEEFPSLAELYEGALKLMFEIQIPGGVMNIAHNMREIYTGLLNLKLGQSRKTQYETSVKNLVENFQSEGFRLGASLSQIGMDSQANLPSSSPDIISLPYTIYRAVEEVIKNYEDGKDNSIKERTRKLCAVYFPENTQLGGLFNPQVELFKKMYDWIIKTAHRSGKSDIEYDKDELSYWFDIFETFLNTLAQNFYKTTDKLDEILEEANS